MTESPFFEDVFNLLDESMMGFGFGDIQFVVADTNPKQAVIISDQTEVIFNPDKNILAPSTFLLQFFK